MISQIWICKCDLCGKEEQARMRIIERAGIEHRIPDCPEDWEYLAGSLDNNHHICPDCWQKLLEEHRHVWD